MYFGPVYVDYAAFLKAQPNHRSTIYSSIWIFAPSLLR